MVFFNYSTMQMAAKVVYYGPGLCGKTTNLQHVFSHTSSESRGEMVSLETETDRTLFFDLLPLDVGSIQGFNTRIQLYTVPGQVFYNTTRKLVLKGVDGVVFVADSQRPLVVLGINYERRTSFTKKIFCFITYWDCWLFNLIFKSNVFKGLTMKYKMLSFE